MACIWKGDVDRAVTCFNRTAGIKHDHGRAPVERFVYRSRVKHDAEQVQYLLTEGRIGEEYRQYLAELTRLQSTLDQAEHRSNRVPVTPTDLAGIAPSFNKLVHVPPCETNPEGALNSHLDVEAIEARYRATKPEVTFVDDLLNPPLSMRSGGSVGNPRSGKKIMRTDISAPSWGRICVPAPAADCG